MALRPARQPAGLYGNEHVGGTVSVAPQVDADLTVPPSDKPTHMDALRAEHSTSFDHNFADPVLATDTLRVSRQNRPGTEGCREAMRSQGTRII